MNDDLKVVHVMNTKDDSKGYLIFCPACQCSHLFDKRWKFNDDFDFPTFTPSMHIMGNLNTRVKTKNKHGHKCHSFVTDGKIRFLSDCTHDMANTTVTLEPF